MYDRVALQDNVWYVRDAGGTRHVRPMYTRVTLHAHVRTMSNIRLRYVHVMRTQRDMYIRRVRSLHCRLMYLQRVYTIDVRLTYKRGTTDIQIRYVRVLYMQCKSYITCYVRVIQMRCEADI